MGLATDPSSSSIPGVSVVLTNNDTGVKRTAATNGSGVYSFPDLAPGTYRLGAGAATVHYVTRSREKSTLPFA